MYLSLQWDCSLDEFNAEKKWQLANFVSLSIIQMNIEHQSLHMVIALLVY